jgi:hypothetical protein
LDIKRYNAPFKGEIPIFYIKAKHARKNQGERRPRTYRGKSLTKKWQVTIPLKGLDLELKDGFEFQNATLKTRPSKEKKRPKKKEEAMVTVDVDGDLDTARKKASALIDRISARLSYSCGEEVRLKEEVYLRQLEPKTGKKGRKKGWGYDKHLQTVRKRVTIGDRRRALIRFVMELEDVKQEKQDVISNTVAYYREALAAKNPFQQIVTLFSCIQVIVKDVCGNTKGSSICKVLQDFVNLQSKQCDEYYHDYRSAADHGDRDIIDTEKMRDATT